MFQLDFTARVWLVLGQTDMRKAINGLSDIVTHLLGLDPMSGHYFVFCGKSRKTIKVLYWDRNGYSLWYKRLEEDRFYWPRTSEDVVALTGEQMSWLLSGLDWTRAHSKRRYSA